MLYHRIQFTKGFTKQFKKLKDNQQTRFYERLELFTKNPNDRTLRDHALKGKYKGYRSIDVQADLRALYYIQDDKIIIFALIGTHSQLYG
ncbi:MAG TPA: type II toxin-antitoxin system mRNA interferase toxin, RelE/StbE family [Candidatus Saccharimonadales bacterium]|nr:type II toxin-antitoxin system mRNA interferase toxin, RelE/StbE family [Candidatus Saccharimonadales bacterium]